MERRIRRSWHQQPEETNEQYKLFQAYLRMGRGRTIVRVERRAVALKEAGRYPDGLLEPVDGEKKGTRESPRWSYVGAVARKNHWKARAQEYDDYVLQKRQQEEERLIAHDIAEANRRRRISRDRNWKLSSQFVKEIAERLQWGGRPKLDKEGQLVVNPETGEPEIAPWSPKDLRELGILADRLGVVEDRAFRGLPDPSMVQEGQALGEGIAKAFDEFRRKRALESEGVNPDAIPGLECPESDSLDDPE